MYLQDTATCNLCCVFCSVLDFKMNANMMLQYGLLWAGYSEQRQSRFLPTNKEAIFCSLYGSSPFVLFTLWNDLVSSEDPQVVLNPNIDASHFLLVMRFLKGYDTSACLVGAYHSSRTSFKWKRWSVLASIEGLMQHKVRQL